MVRPTLAPPTYVVVDTHFVVPPRRFRDEPYTEIVIGQSHDADAQRRILICREPALVAHALRIEGTEERVAVTWRSEPGPRRTRLVLESLS